MAISKRVPVAISQKIIPKHWKPEQISDDTEKIRQTETSKLGDFDFTENIILMRQFVAIFPTA